MRARELARLIYRNFSEANARVRIAVAKDSELDDRSPPIFIMSPYRSGTTLLRYALDSHSKLAAPPESDFVHLLGPLLSDGGALSGFESMGFDAEHVRDRLQVFVSYFFENYASSWGKRRWVDKSPIYVPHAEFVRSLFPDAYYIVLHRHPLDQVHSLTKGGEVMHESIRPYHVHGQDLRIAGARYWAAQTEILERVATWDRSVVVRYEDLCSRPREELERILEAIAECWDESVLHFHESPHDLGKESVRIRGTVGFVPRMETYLAWPPGLIQECWTIVSPSAEQLGYKVAPR